MALSAAICSSILCPPGLLPSLAAEPPALVQVAAPSARSPVAVEVYNLLDKYYLDRSFNGVDWKATRDTLSAPLTDKEALDAADKVVRSLGDRYTRLLPPAQTAKLNKYDVTGVGINLVISDAGRMLVGAVPPPDSDAARAGITFGDEVTEINGKSTTGMTSFDALDVIQRDTEVVHVRVRADGSGERELTLRRAFLAPKDPVRTRLVVTSNGQRVGYIKLAEFNSQCKAKMKAAIDDLQAKGASSLVLDLRGNGGGVLDGALGIAGFFSDHPLVLYITDANGAKQPLYSREDLVSTLPLQVWVDARTASSSEVLAAALHDNCRARVVGSRTYGKGVIQGVFGLSDGGALVETVASYATPGGLEINNLGVTPDEQRIFVSDVLGSSFLDTDVKATRFDSIACAKPVARAEDEESAGGGKAATAAQASAEKLATASPCARGGIGHECR